MSKRAKAELLLVAATFFWGATFVIVKGALSDASPLMFIALRFLLAGLLMWGVMARGRIERQAVLPSLLLGMLLFAGFAFQTWGLLYTTPSKSAFVTGFSVILVPVISIFSGYRLSRGNTAAAALGLAGLYFLVLPSGIGLVNRGDLMTLFAAISFAFHIVLLGTWSRRISFMQLAPGQIIVVGTIAILAAPFAPASALHWTGRLVFAVVVTAIFATAFAFSAQVWAQQYTPPAHTALIFTLEPVFALLTSLIVTGEHFGGKEFVGFALILAGMIVAERWGGTTPAPVEG
ncbi:MAG: DMT family transporter [Acidobacteria bacterium]|nr:MAG: DMT family transporter [Acidobacteriota bacterium]